MAFHPTKLAGPVLLLGFLLALGGCAKHVPETRLADRYCYRTLAEVDCFFAPQPGQEARRVGWWDGPIAE